MFFFEKKNQKTFTYGVRCRPVCDSQSKLPCVLIGLPLRSPRICPLSKAVARTHAKFTPHRPTTSTNSGTRTDVAMPFSPTAIPANVPAS